MAAPTAPLLLAMYPGAAAELGQIAVAATSAVIALVIAGWVGVTLVPILAKRTPLRWLGYSTQFRITLEGGIYLGGPFLVALAAPYTCNHLLFLILACPVSP